MTDPIALTFTYRIPDDEAIVMAALYSYARDAEERQSSALRRRTDEVNDAYVSQSFEHVAKRYEALITRIYGLREEVTRHKYLDFRTPKQIVESLQQTQKELET